MACSSLVLDFEIDFDNLQRLFSFLCFLKFFFDFALIFWEFLKNSWFISRNYCFLSNFFGSWLVSRLYGMFLISFGFLRIFSVFSMLSRLISIAYKYFFDCWIFLSFSKICPHIFGNLWKIPELLLEIILFIRLFWCFSVHWRFFLILRELFENFKDFCLFFEVLWIFLDFMWLVLDFYVSFLVFSVLSGLISIVYKDFFVNWVLLYFSMIFPPLFGCL